MAAAHVLHLRAHGVSNSQIRLLMIASSRGAVRRCFSVALLLTLIHLFLLRVRGLRLPNQLPTRGRRSAWWLRWSVDRRPSRGTMVSGMASLTLDTPELRPIGKCPLGLVRQIALDCASGQCVVAQRLTVLQHCIMAWC
eukprot:1837723-Rhodomonas_salina.2